MFRKLGANRSHRMRVPVGHGATRLHGFKVEHDVTVDYCHRVAAVRNDRVRNLLITQAYHDISREMARVIGLFHMNWCTIACWASKRAGQTIRGEDVAGQRALVGVLERVPIRAPPSLDVATEITSTAIAVGIRVVFEEVARAFASFLETFGHDNAPDAAKLEAWAERFVVGAPETGGQDPLRRAFELYARARFETDMNKKAEHLHAANIYVALQEQTRLQSRIAAGMPGGSSYLITKIMLTLNVGATVSHRLGYDLPTDAPFGRYLDTIEDRELTELIARFDPEPDSTRGSGAHRWDRLEDRMHFIVDLFRLHASDAQLFAAPFTVSEWAGLSRRLAREALPS